MTEKTCHLAVLCGLALWGSTATAAELSDSASRAALDPAGENALPYLQCVPYARQVSGIQIHGDALTWWDKAEGRYARGKRPMPGAVMSFRPYGSMQLGHVAAVSRVIDSRTVLLRHANWSPIDGRRGQIEDNVRAVDVSPDNDWSQVRVWYAPIGGLGTTAWPVNGFIYPEKPGRLTVLASAGNTTARTVPLKAQATQTPQSRIGADFLKGVRPEVDARAAQSRRFLASSYAVPKPSAPRTSRTDPAFADDPIGRIIAAKTR
ncbi:Peptidase C51 domain-containing protein [Novosphingobium lubricantis]|jgi:surface antigen